MPLPVTLSALDLGALLCSRICHDIISPVGAINNGLELLEEGGADEDAMALIKSSARNASARLQFARIAFGAAGSAGVQIDTGDAQHVATQYFANEKPELTWEGARVLLPKNKVKLLLNMLVVAQHTIPRGGMLTIDPIGEGETMSFRITATGHNARLPQNISELLSGERGPAADAHAIQPYYTRLLAQACGLTVSLKHEGEAIIVTAS